MAEQRNIGANSDSDEAKELKRAEGEALKAEIIAALTNRIDVKCWACGRDEWTITGDIDHLGICPPAYSMRTLTSDPQFRFPIVALTCDHCATIWEISLIYLVKLVRAGNDVLASKTVAGTEARGDVK